MLKIIIIIVYSYFSSIDIFPYFCSIDISLNYVPFTMISNGDISGE